MADIEFDWDNPTAIAAFPVEYEEDVIEDIVTVLEEYGPKIVEKAQEYCPVDTGALQESIEFEVKDQELEVFSWLDYYPFVEFGTVKMEGRFMVSRAYSEYEDEIINAVAEKAKDSAGLY